MKTPKIFIITGMSGSGKSVVLKILEDAGFFCVDNIPVQLVDSLLEILKNQGRLKIAIAIDARDRKSILDLYPKIISLRKHYSELTTIFLNASNSDLIKRYSETRRRHPFSFELENSYPEDKMAQTIGECIDSEREILSEIEKVCIRVDTSALKPLDLKHIIREFLQLSAKDSLVIIQSFAFKRGIPLDSDLVFDSRCLPNPFYEDNLKDLTGKDDKVIKFLQKQKTATRLVSEISIFLDRWLPFYLEKERSFFCISIGCTGGKHRSVFCTEQIASRLGENWTTSVRHRNL